MTRSAKGTIAETGRQVRQKAGLNRGIFDAAPGLIMSNVQAKAESAGLRTIFVDPKKTGRCWDCGIDVPKSSLSESIFVPV